MTSQTRSLLTPSQRARLAQGQVIRFKAPEAVYWQLVQQSEYQVHYTGSEIIMSMSYESDTHAERALQLSFLLKQAYDAELYRLGNSNRPICIPACNHAIYNPDGSVILRAGQQYEYRPGMNAELEPVVVFEILSNSTRRVDFEDKLPCYKQIVGLRYILYVEQQEIRVLVYERESDVATWSESTYTKLDDEFSNNISTIQLASIYDA